MDDLLQDFLAETRESLDEVDNELVLFEQNPNDDARLASIFRLVHTIKGTCGFLGLPRLEALSHAAETLMGNYRDGEEISNRGVSAILTAIDRLKEILQGLAVSGGAEPAGSDQDLIEELQALSTPSNYEKEPDPQDLAAAQSMALPLDVEPETLPGEISLEQLEQAFQNADGPQQFSDVSAAAEFADMAARELAEAASKPDEASHIATDPVTPGSPTQQLIRVNVKTLEQLMTMVSELVLTRNQLLETGRNLEAGPLNAPLQRLTNVTAELQQTVMKTRMQPISTAWKKLPRIVRDLSRSVGKDIELLMSGEDTELDRQVLELIQDPLTHMVRNSADHGLETAEERLCLGKPGRGTIWLSAAQKGGFIVVEISDDGRGLPLERIKKKAVDNGMMNPTEVETFTDQQLFSLIFQPGFSTASEITSVSGRGVGMDVVRNNLEMIGGAISVESNPGQGTKFTIKIPLTLAIISALLVEAGGQRYAVPQNAVIEMIRLGGNSEHRIEQINGSLLLRRRGDLLPVACLGALLTSAEQQEMAEDELQRGFVMIMKVGPLRYGMIVDAVFHSEEIVVKPLSTKLADITYYSGNTILGDGNVVLILDPHGFADLLGDSASLSTSQVVMPEVRKSASETETSMLLFQAGEAEPLAVPLTLVSRIEDFNADVLEQVDGRVAVQYRGELMPLIFAPGASERVDVARTVLVFADSGRTMGLVIDKVVDIVESKLTLDLASEQPGVLGTAVINGKATAILDVGHFLPLAFADWFRRRTSDADNGTQRLLLIDDSSFFLNMLTPVLTAAGFDVTAADSARAALELLEAESAYDVIVSDVEMPQMTGLEFVAVLRKLDGYDRVPAIALSATCTPRSVDAGLAAGFDDFIAKFDRAGLIDALHGLRSGEGRLAA